MRIDTPLKLSAGAHIYKVSLNQVVADDGHYATCNHKLQEIWIAPNVPDSQKLVSLVKEYLRMVCRTQVIRVDEDDADRLAEGFADFVRQLGISLDWSKVPVLEVVRQ